MSMNKFMVTGRLTADPELRYTQDGSTAVVNFTLANNWYTKNAEGKTEQKVQFIPFSVFGPTAERLANYKKKGDWIEVEGHIVIKTIPKEDGSNLQYTNLVAQSVFYGPSAQAKEMAEDKTGTAHSETEAVPTAASSH